MVSAMTRRQKMTTLLFKKSLTDSKVIEIPVKSWCSTKNGVYYQEIDSDEYKFISSNDVYFYGVR